VDTIRTAYYIRGLELMKLIFAVLDVSLTMGLTRCYKTECFFYINMTYHRVILSPNWLVTDSICHRSNCHRYGLLPIWPVSRQTRR